MSTLTLTAENPEILLQIQSIINNITGISEVKQKESADLRKARALAELKADLKEAFAEVRAHQKGEITLPTLEEFLAELKAEDNEN